MGRQRKRRTGNHEIVCKQTHRECICLRCKHDEEFCCEYHNKGCEDGCPAFEPEQRGRK